MADTPWNTIDPLPAGKNQDIELLVKSNGANYREKAEQLMQAFSGLGTVDGSCTSAIDAEEKTVTLAEYALNVLPREFSVTFTNANTYGNGTTTYPILKVYNSNNQLLGSLPAANSRGRYAGNGAWEAGDILYFRVMAGRACIINSEISTTRDLQARVKDMTLSALDLTDANKRLPVNSSAVSNALNNCQETTTANLKNVLKFDNLDNRNNGITKQGFITETRHEIINLTRLHLEQFFNVQEGDVVRVCSDGLVNNYGIGVFDDNTRIEDSGWIPTNTTYTITNTGHMYINLRNSDNTDLSPQSGGYIAVFINNRMDILFSLLH